MSRGFLGTAASFSSDVTLVVELGMGVALLVGTVLARRGSYRAHAWCQSSMVLLNLVVITLTMAPSFRRSFSAPEPLCFVIRIMCWQPSTPLWVPSLRAWPVYRVGRGDPDSTGKASVLTV
jgi:hypothetical protein